MEKSAKAAFRYKGIKGLIRYMAQKLVYMEDVEDRINTCNYIISNYCDINKFPKATGDLALLQTGDAILLAIVDTLCRKHGFEYWLDCGSLLGAFRHKGFILWDDDADICMMRDEYEKAFPTLNEELNKYGLEATEWGDGKIGRASITYQHRKTGLWLDLWPCEYTTIDFNDSLKIDDFKRRQIHYRKKWKSNCKLKSREELFKIRIKAYLRYAQIVDKVVSASNCWGHFVLSFKHFLQSP